MDVIVANRHNILSGAFHQRRLRTVSCRNCKLIGRSSRKLISKSSLVQSKAEEREDEVVDDQEGPILKLALAALYFYRGTISPLMPKMCRFVPSCSEYSIDSFKKYGVLKGGTLTAWRLARCNPFGGKGYDPPKWPPIGLEWIFKDA